MKTLFIANVKPFKGTLEESLISAFQANKVTIDTIYPERAPLIKNRHAFLGRLESKLMQIIGYSERDLSKKIKKMDLKPYAFVFVLKGTSLNIKTLKYIKDKDIKVVCYNPDDPYNRASTNKNIRLSMRLYDIYFIWSRKLCEKIQKEEKMRCAYLPFAADLSLHDVRSHQECFIKKYDISFVGNWDEEREGWLERIREKERLHLFGNNWGYKLKSKVLKKCFSGYPVTGDAFTKVVQESVININILRLQNKGSNNMRSFEIPASGGFMLHEYSEEVEVLFEEGREVEFFRDHRELNEKIGYYLQHPDKAEQIARNAYKKVLSGDYTYNESVKTILREVHALL